MKNDLPDLIRPLWVQGNAFWAFSSNKSASFQGYINKILAKKLYIFVIVYLNDIFIYIKETSQAHVNAV